MNNELEVICLGQFLNNCTNCKKDTDPNSKPNNYDCPRYIPVTVRYFNAVKLADIPAKKD
jgi:hypothetical protein